jgi:hypothetical protein
MSSHLFRLDIGVTVMQGRAAPPGRLDDSLHQPLHVVVASQALADSGPYFCYALTAVVAYSGPGVRGPVLGAC